MSSGRLEQASFHVFGMDCVEEIVILRDELRRPAGVEDLSFDLLNAKITITVQSGKTTPDAPVASVVKTGMQAPPRQEQALSHSKPILGFG